MKDQILDLLATPERTDRGCLLWTGWLNDDGYGYIRFNGRDQPAHRVAYELAIGPIPTGHEVDHSCQVRACIEPTHLEAVTHAENQRRIRGRKTHCVHGHPRIPENIRTRPNGRTYCAECDRMALRLRYANQKAVVS